MIAIFFRCILFFSSSPFVSTSDLTTMTAAYFVLPTGSADREAVHIVDLICDVFFNVVKPLGRWVSRFFRKSHISLGSRKSQRNYNFLNVSFHCHGKRYWPTFSFHNPFVRIFVGDSVDFCCRWFCISAESSFQHSDFTHFQRQILSDLMAKVAAHFVLSTASAECEAECIVDWIRNIL